MPWYPEQLNNLTVFHVIILLVLESDSILHNTEKIRLCIQMITPPNSFSHTKYHAVLGVKNTHINIYAHIDTC